MGGGQASRPRKHLASAQGNTCGFRQEGPGNMEAEAEHLVDHHGGGENEGKENGVGAGVVLRESS